MGGLEENINRAVEALLQAEAVMINAGAGMGVDSGLPDFRGDEGFWKAYPPIAKLGISFSQMANPQWFEKEPQLAWGFYGHRLNLYRKTVPHSGFLRLLSIAEKKRGGYFVFTSNVDGQFQKAGFESEKIMERHGSIHHLQCANPCGSDVWDAGEITIEVDETTFRASPPLPRCIHCDTLARPNILMFGDWRWISHRTDSQGERLSRWLERVAAEKMKLVIVEAGAGNAVPTVRTQSEQVAARYKGVLIRINPRDHYVPSGHISVPLGSAEGAERIATRLCSSP